MGSQGGVGPFGMQKASQYLGMFRMSDSQRLSPPDPARLSPSFMEGSLEVKLPKIWTNGKAEVGRVREERVRRKKIRQDKESDERRYRREKRLFCGSKQWPQRTSPRHSAPPAKEVTGDNMSTCLVQEHVARHETEQMYDQTKHSGHRHSDVEPGDASASSHVGSKSASQATRLRAGRDIRQSQGRELTGPCLHVCPARRVSPSPLLPGLVTKHRLQAHKSASFRTTGQGGDR